MLDIELQLKSWEAEERATGELVRRLVGKRFETIMLKAYQRSDVAITPEMLASEQRKFSFIARGDFCREYFAMEAALIENIADQIDYYQYMLGYGAFTADLISALSKESSWFGANRDKLIHSLMKSIFSEVSVIFYHYLEHQIRLADKASAIAEAERLQVATEDRATMKILADGLSALADCDLTYRIADEMPAKSEMLKQDFNKAANTLQEAILAISMNTAIFAHPLEKVKLAILRALPLLLQSFNRETDVIKILDEGINIDGLS
jgi:methyl-accepting chemotaxis protein